MSKRPTIAQLSAQIEAQQAYIEELEQDRIKLRAQLAAAQRSQIKQYRGPDFKAMREAAAKLAKQLGRSVSKQEVLDFMEAQS